MGKRLLLKALLNIWKYPFFLIILKKIKTPEYVYADVKRILKKDCSKFEIFVTLLTDSNFVSIFQYRAGSDKLAGRFANALFRGNPNIEIYCGSIGPGFKINHKFGAVILARELGSNVTICQGVTVGKGGGISAVNDDDEIPSIGSNVLIGANALVLGRISIGDISSVGAGAVVTKDVPEDTVVVGNPAHPLIKK